MPANQTKQPKAQNQKPTKPAPEKSAPNEQNEAQTWDKVDSLFTVARNTYFQGNSTFLEILDSLIATLQDMRENEVRPLGGLGTQKKSMKLEDQEKSEEETPPANPNL
jgi:hypothetical protein